MRAPPRSSELTGSGRFSRLRAGKSNLGNGMSKTARLLGSIACVTLVAGCGGGGGGSPPPAPAPPPAPTPQTFTVGGTVSGLDASGLVLQNNAGNDLPITANGAFTFSTAVASGTAYGAVTVKTQPNAGPAQACSVTSGSGTVAGGAVTNVGIACVTQTGKFLYVPNANTSSVSAYTDHRRDRRADTPLPGSPLRRSRCRAALPGILQAGSCTSRAPAPRWLHRASRRTPIDAASAL